MLTSGYGYIDLEVRPAHKRLCDVPLVLQGFTDLLHHNVGTQRVSGARDEGQLACLSKFKESLQAFHALGIGALQIYLTCLQGGEHHHLVSGT